MAIRVGKRIVLWVYIYTQIRTNDNILCGHVDMLQGYPGGYQAADNTAQMHQLTIQNAGKQQPIWHCQPSVPYQHKLSLLAVHKDWNGFFSVFEDCMYIHLKRSTDALGQHAVLYATVVCV